MRRSIGSGSMFVTIILALSVLVAFAGNETASKDNVTANNTTNATFCANNTTINGSLDENCTNPFANARGECPGGSESTGEGAA